MSQVQVKLQKKIYVENFKKKSLEKDISTALKFQAVTYVYLIFQHKKQKTKKQCSQPDVL